MLSDEEADNEDFVPPSLAAFLEQADQALNEHTKMFMDEISPSPTPNPNHSGESTDYELSNLHALQTDMANISILDRPNSILSTRSDDSAFQSPVPRNPAADFTFSAMDAATPSSVMTEEKKSPDLSKEAEDSVKSPSKHAEESVFYPVDDEHLSSPTNGSLQAPDTMAENNSGIDGLEVKSPKVVDDSLRNLTAQETPPEKSEGAECSLGDSDNARKNNVELKESVVEKQAFGSAAQPDLQVLQSFSGEGTSPRPVGDEESPRNLCGDNRAFHQENQRNINRSNSFEPGTASNAEHEKNDSLGLGTPTSVKSGSTAQLDLEDPLGLGTPGSIASSVGNDDDSFKSEEQGNTNASIPTSMRAITEEPKETTEEKASANREGGEKFPLDVLRTVTNDQEQTQEGQIDPKPQPEARSLFGAFASFARSVVPANRGPSPEESKANTPTKPNFSQEVSTKAKISLSRVQAVPSSTKNVADAMPVAMPTETVNTDDEIIGDTENARGQSYPNNLEGMQVSVENEVDDRSKIMPMEVESTVDIDESCVPQVSTSPSFIQRGEINVTGIISTSTMKTNPLKVTKPNISPSSRLFQPTASRVNATATSSRKTTKPLLSPSSRLVQPTASRRRQIEVTSPSTASTPSPKVASRAQPLSSAKRPTPTKIPIPSATRSTAAPKRSVATTSESTTSTCRFMQPTASKRAHTADNKDSTARKRAAGSASSQLPRRLMRGTAASTARVSSSSHPSEQTHKQVDPTDAVAKAKERVRLRKLEETKQAFQSNDATFNVGTKPKTSRDTASRASNSPRFATPTTAAKAHQQPSALSMAQSAVFFGRALRDDSSQPARNVKRTGRTTPRLSSRLLKGTASSNAMTQAPRVGAKSAIANKSHKTPALTMAQCTDLFGKGLRGDSSPASRTSRSPGHLTIPETPKFATSAKYGNDRNRSTGSPATAVSLAQSTTLLANTLRGNDPVQVSRGNRPRLTRPESPKFHKTHKRELPKSSAEIEAEQLRDFRAQPFKANSKGSNKGTNDKTLHTGSSTGLQKVTKRTLTKPEPFHLSSGDTSRSTRMKYTSPAENILSTSQFRARPLPPSSMNSDGRKTLTTPQPFGFAVDMKSKNARDNGDGDRSSPPKMFKARPLPKSTFKNPSIPVHNLSSPPAKAQNNEVSSSTNKGFLALRYKGAPPPPSPTTAKQSKSPTTPEPFELESVKRHDAFQELVQEKIAAEEEIEKNSKYKALPLPKSTYKPR